MKKEIKEMLTGIVGEDLGQQIFDANFPEPLDGYMPGNILTFAELKALPEGTVIHVLYFDEDGEEREDGFQTLSKGSDSEWSAGAFPFPIDELKDDQLIEKCDNSGWTFTLRAALPAKKGEYVEMKKKQRKAIRILERMQDLSSKGIGCKDKEKKKKINKEFKELEKELRKMKVI